MKLNLSDFWSLFSIPIPIEEYRFCEDRRWRFDYAWPRFKVAVEVEGGVWIKAVGGHNRPIHFVKDMEKYNRATFDGWKVFRFTPQQFKTGEAGEFLENYFKNRLDQIIDFVHEANSPQEA